MRSILLIISLLFLLFSPIISGVNAQETVIIDGREVTRVVIAPPRSPIAVIIKKGLRQNYDSKKFESPAWYSAQKLYYFYGARHFEPIWLEEGQNGEANFSKRAQQIIELFKNSYLLGLNPDDYLVDDINLQLVGSEAADLAKVETIFSDIVLKFAQHLYGGRINPKKVSPFIDYKVNKVDRSELLLKLINSDNPVQILLSLEPKHKEYALLKSALARYYDGSAEQAIIIPGGKILRLDDRDERIELIRQRLGLEITDANKNLFDETLLLAVEKFQQNMGLNIDGVIGPATIAALNGGNATTKEDIIANMERWRWMPRDLGDFNVFVNIPQFRLEIFDKGKAVHSTRVIVGKVKFKTPVFSDEIEHIVVNPYWNIPRSILNNELAPSIKSNPNFLNSQNMELLLGGKTIDATKIDWSETSLDKFHVRQRPGKNNALGSVKFLFPNKHAVYLHDTPAKSLFSRSTRAFSHGCVRVKDPWGFAEALLQYEPKISFASLVSQRGGAKERWNNVSKHIPVHLAYFTLRADENGSIRSYYDIYGHNERLKQLLGLN